MTLRNSKLIFNKRKKEKKEGMTGSRKGWNVDDSLVSTRKKKMNKRIDLKED